MLCSSQELAWTDDGPDEVAVLLPSVYVGMNLDDERHPLDLLDPARERYLEKHPFADMFNSRMAIL